MSPPRSARVRLVRQMTEQGPRYRVAALAAPVEEPMPTQTDRALQTALAHTRNLDADNARLRAALWAILDQLTTAHGAGPEEPGGGQPVSWHEPDSTIFHLAHTALAGRKPAVPW